MAEYLVRVELFNANADDYNELHEKMKNKGLVRQIKSDGGVFYEMPSGTYFGSSELSALDLQVWVSGMADPHSSPKRAAVFVGQLSDWSAFLDRS
ncbi:hypothetical protein SAMN05216509_5314 [Pseudomonas sp. B10]|uniref:hypothetical protein n=1 Tax=Pseudomonas sp. B10 TaxID=118613 RepID=UPI00095372DA|nr:hypothetical protein [Pseudomonas sp. B10]SIR83845.1 hypothetical protein SAMN05216509_5314 [Pseudomonas sp. B10]